MKRRREKRREAEQGSIRREAKRREAEEEGSIRREEKLREEKRREELKKKTEVVLFFTTEVEDEVGCKAPRVDPVGRSGSGDASKYRTPVNVLV